jgi:hypothetical protein
MHFFGLEDFLEQPMVSQAFFMLDGLADQGQP